MHGSVKAFPQSSVAVVAGSGSEILRRILDIGKVGKHICGGKILAKGFISGFIDLELSTIRNASVLLSTSLENPVSP